MMQKNSKRDADASVTEKQQAAAVNRADFWMGILALLCVMEFFISVAALCYGVLTTPPRPAGASFRFIFPWVGWFAAMLAAPGVVVLLAWLSLRRDAGEKPDNGQSGPAWAGRLPQRALRAYALIKDVPLLAGASACIALAGALLLIDGAFSLTRDIVLALLPHALYFIAGGAVVAVVVAGLTVWFRYKTRRLAAEYAFRREVLERTGVILVDKTSQAVLPPDGRGREARDLLVLEVLPFGASSGAEDGTARALPAAGTAQNAPPEHEA